MQEKLECFFRELLYTKSINFAYHLLVDVRNFKDTDWDQVKQIYQLGIDTGVATFEVSPPETLKEWKEKIFSLANSRSCCFPMVKGGLHAKMKEDLTFLRTPKK